MSKKTEKDRARDDEDLEDEDGSTDEDNDDDGEEEAKATAVHGRDDDDDDGAEPEDPYWWTPHAVLSALVLIGLLGFFGMFNKTPLSRLAAPVAPAPDEHEHAAASPAPTPTPTPRPAKSAQPPREMFGAKHLLVMYKGSRRAPPTIERTKEEAQARATEAMKKAKADPSKFADIVKEYSDEPGADKRGGDLGKFPKGAMVPEFQAGLETIKVGEVSDLVETPFGFHVILRTQ
ncbi:peptidylprolyl isomerase [Sorangium cellulosum]|nr:peptidylprolyl isomerase [Sorangium cellulosum]